MKHLDLFSGIGGFAYAADQVWDDVQHIFCDNDEFCKAVLKKHWPESPIFSDIKELTSLQIFESIKAWHIREAQNMMGLLGCTDKGCPFKKSLTSTELLDKRHGKSLNDEVAYSDRKRNTDPKTDFSEVPRLMTMPKISSNMLFERESSQENLSVNNAETAVLSKMDALKSKPTTPITINLSKSCGCVKDAIMNGTKTRRLYQESEAIDLLTGGFPCQSFSQAGKRKGRSDNRWLWPEMYALIQSTKPRWVIAENVPGIITIEDGLVFEQVCLDLEATDYEVQSFIVPAAAVNAPHRRDRVWIVAHASDRSVGRVGLEWQPDQETAKSSKKDSPVTDSECPRWDEGHKQDLQSQEQEPKRPQFSNDSWERYWQEVAFATCDVGVDDGLPPPIGATSRWNHNYPSKMEERSNQSLRKRHRPANSNGNNASDKGDKSMIRVCKKCYRPVSLTITGWQCIKIHGAGSIKIPRERVNWEE